MAAPRRKTMIGQRRRAEDEGEDESPGAVDHDDDSATDGSITDDAEDGDDSDTSHIDASPRTLKMRKPANGAVKSAARRTSKESAKVESKPISDTEAMLHGLAITDTNTPVQEIHFDDVAPTQALRPASPSAPVVVSSASVRHPQEQLNGRRRQEHEDYKKRRDEDPAFVPNRGAFFMHDHRHAGPAANGFRPFGRGRGRGGRGGIGGPFAPINHIQRPGDPTTNSPWTHDMHEAVTSESIPRRPRQLAEDEGPPNGNGYIPTREPNSTPINRTLSTEKHIGNVQVRISLPSMQAPIIKSGLAVKQYTKLPDHRPPMRRDKPVRISLPERQPRYVYPAVDRSFIFIPRAMRPNNQQRMRGGKARSGLGSMGGFSRRTSVFGGSYYGSMYSPSVMSRRSSIVQDREFMFSPAGSVISRAPVPVENPKPVVRLPPMARVDAPLDGFVPISLVPESSIVDMPQLQTYPLPQKPAFQEYRPASMPMHQPRPQKNISVADIDSPNLAQGPQSFQQAFHQQMPVHVSNGFGKESHVRQPSYMSQRSTGTPLSQIPERAIHAAPFQPHVYGQLPQHQPQHSYYPQQAYPAQPQQPYHYPPSYSGASMAPPAPAPTYAPFQQPPYAGPSQQDLNAAHDHGQSVPSNLVAQEVNGMVYYYDASQLPSVNSFPTSYPPQGYQPSVMGMGGMVTPSPDGFYYPQNNAGMVYYQQ